MDDFENVKLHTGTRVKLKRVPEDALPAEFVEKLGWLAHTNPRVQAVYVFALENAETGEQQLCLALGVSKPLLARRNDEEFLRLAEEIQLLLPEDLPVNLYRLGSSPQVARFCLETLEPLYLRSTTWRDKQLKKLR